MVTPPSWMGGLMKTFLTPEEIAQLTNRLRRNAQVRVLRFMGVEHRTRPDGSVAVMRAHVEKLFCGEQSALPAQGNNVEPNWSAI